MHNASVAVTYYNKYKYYKHVYIQFYTVFMGLKSRSHCPGFQFRCRYGVDTGANRDHTYRSDAGNHRIESAYNGKWSLVSFFKTTGTHRAAKQRRLFRGITVALPA